ncbi:hypothetical protein IscW_ISCW007210 [Ixodes scapularis]|uniref:Uncharacterized protein n=2 Tax=Ixodes scapularis TaxID=6945 RepID=B7PVN5_IXOSC|nr:hypothetical protein IscW_ISCW007210 [Ixodes scapularis]|eukprot:XP_002408264.1 hypothetical protein IscW_ISCW007210 [Ixodes scapularis]
MTHVSFLWSEMFHRMAKIKKTFKLQDFYITDTSLEHIYLSFTHREASVAALQSATPKPVVLGL